MLELNYLAALVGGGKTTLFVGYLCKAAPKRIGNERLAKPETLETDQTPFLIVLRRLTNEAKSLHPRKDFFR